MRKKLRQAVHHLVLNSRNAGYAGSTGTPSHRSTIARTGKPTPCHRFEYGVDAFALDALCRRSKRKETPWINLATIHLLSLFFNHIETELGRPLCPYHPPPLARSRRLREQLHQAIAPPDQDPLELVDALFSGWLG